MYTSRFGIVVVFHKGPANDSLQGSTSNAAPGRHNLMSGTTAVALILLNAALSGAFALIAGKPAGRLNNIAYLVIMSFCNAIASPFATIITIVAFAFQVNRSSQLVAAGRTSRTRPPNALNTQTLALQLVIFLALAISWPFRLNLPSNLGSPEEGWEWMLYEWYPMVGWPCVNNAIIAIGQYVVLYIMAGADASGTHSQREERCTLLD